MLAVVYYAPPSDILRPAAASYPLYASNITVIVTLPVSASYILAPLFATATSAAERDAPLARAARLRCRRLRRFHTLHAML